MTHLSLTYDVSRHKRWAIHCWIVGLGIGCFWLRTSCVSYLIPVDLWPCMLFYLCIFMNPFVPLWFLVVLGFGYDCMWGTVLGMHGILWLMIYGIICVKRRFLVKLSVLMLGAAYAVFIMAYLLLTTPFSFSHFFGQTAFLVALMPWIFHMCQKIFAIYE